MELGEGRQMYDSITFRLITLRQVLVEPGTQLVTSKTYGPSSLPCHPPLPHVGVIYTAQPYPHPDIKG